MNALLPTGIKQVRADIAKRSRQALLMQGFFMVLSLLSLCSAAQKNEAQFQNENFWKVLPGKSITWNILDEKKLPHADNIEMSGEQVSAIINYSVDERKRLSIKRTVIFPQLRTFIKTNDPDYFQYRAYLKDDYRDNVLPVITVGEKIFYPGALDSISINGNIRFHHQAVNGLRLVRTFIPSMKSRLLVEKWSISNEGDVNKKLHFGTTVLQQEEKGIYGVYQRKIFCDARSEVSLRSGELYEFAIYFSASLNNEPAVAETFGEAELLRNRFLDTMRTQFVLESPDTILNTLFYFSKIRAAESIFQTKMGLVHSPGGGRYYTGIWANDQAEYSGPFFPYLGYANGIEAAMNAYRMFLKNIPSKGKIWASFEMNGELPCCSKDRGDAAMIAFGATHFLLAAGNKRYAAELWPLVEWCLAYCETKKTSDGVIASESDELEGRYPTGTANLSTSSLYYGALKQAAFLAKAMGKDANLIESYTTRARKLQTAIETFFGARIENLSTYKYYKENTTLRSWICLPLVMGINNRKEGTLNALFNYLWTDNGVRIEKKDGAKEPDVFWDRGTLYAFRGAFKAGASDKALGKLTSYSATRLLGFHVPYVVEAWPEGGMAHLSAESALYCRIFTEGILGFEPTGFGAFSLQPNLPAGWQTYRLKNIGAFGSPFDIEVIKKNGGQDVNVSVNRKIVWSKHIKAGEKV
ncbi:MAG TPA: hypothetical protein VEY10_09905, partial [Flavisolibacter sp.]|nr:hypothetical protein [Flavisolibacter sp.]